MGLDMKVVAGDPLIAFLQTNRELPIAELYTVVLADGVTVDHLVDLDIDIVYGGNTFKSTSIRFDGLKFKVAVGWQVDEQDIRISAFPGEKLCGTDFFGGIQSGLLDGATITRQRAFWAPTGIPANDYVAPPVGVVTLSTMRVSTITKIGQTHVELKLKSPMVLLNIDMPRNTYGPGCQWSLFDTGCTLLRGSFSNTFTVSTVDATKTIITPTVAVSPNVGADGNSYYGLGRITFTSGALNNLTVSVDSNNATAFTLKFPLVTPPIAGDTFSASAGCSKASATCSSKFSNLPNFRGFPRVPPIRMSF